MWQIKVKRRRRGRRLRRKATKACVDNQFDSYFAHLGKRSFSSRRTVCAGFDQINVVTDSTRCCTCLYLWEGILISTQQTNVEWIKYIFCIFFFLLYTYITIIIMCHNNIVIITLKKKIVFFLHWFYSSFFHHSI